MQGCRDVVADLEASDKGASDIRGGFCIEGIEVEPAEVIDKKSLFGSPWSASTRTGRNNARPYLE
jgi:hypothetical protein